MADLSAVLRKTIDGLPRATPQLRAKVYEKARAAITRQIEAANPPLSDAVVAARRSALEDAIERTEDHYLSLEEAARQASMLEDEPAAPPPPPAPPAPAPRQAAEPPKVSAPSWPPATRPVETPRDRQAEPPVQPEPIVPQRPAAPSAPQMRTRPPEPQPAVDEPPARPFEPSETPEFPARAAEPDDAARPQIEAPFVVPREHDHAAIEDHERDGGQDQAPDEGYYAPAGERRDEASNLGLDGIPEADLEGPRYAPPRRAAKKRRLAPILTGIGAALLLGGAAALGWTYRDVIQSTLVDPSSINSRQTATNQQPATTPTSQGTGATQGTPAAQPDDEDGESEVAALPSQPSTGTGNTPGAAAPDGGTSTPGGQTPSTRRFTQRLLPDGTEVDEGPGAGNANAFEEGTNIAAASPPAEPQPGASPETTVESQIGQNPTTVGGETPPADAGTPPQTPTETATPPASGTAPATSATENAGNLAVGQKAVFYEERSDTEPGTQQSGNVVWSVVNEPPADGQPAEPAIRAVADVPEDNLKMTMTIRRNADPTLPASHVIELQFEVPPGFSGGQVANVQRLALKPTEQARGEPLIGVAGKISDGFFIIALNNLEQATQSNLALLSNEKWIDIPVAYATGRRALMSIEKGIPGERAFKQAMDAWAAKT
ncbi:hypothetical protein [Mangrovicella endophytica]|uniref:hypothetical protein n=1 Tax=Mangrovicella endophytica TaxID=2066697 RepID=UPI0012FFFDA6|nr:hypothetical protein [Mangrovicella endophytica]